MRPEGVSSVAVSSDGKWIASRSGGTIKVWDAEMRPEGVSSVAVSSDGKWIASRSGGTIKVWDAESGRETNTFPCGGTVKVLPAAMRREIRGFLGGPGRQRDVKVLPAAMRREIQTLPEYLRGSASLTISDDGKRIFTGGEDGTVRVWDVETGVEKLTLKGHTGSVTSVAISRDGERLISGTRMVLGRMDGVISVWDTESGKEICSFKGHNTRSQNREPARGVLLSMTISGDGKRIFTGGEDGTVRVWDVETGVEKLTLKGHTGSVTSVAISRDGKRLISGSDDGTVRVWDAVSD
jgi:WD40 repeat protein